MVVRRILLTISFVGRNSCDRQLAEWLVRFGSSRTVSVHAASEAEADQRARLEAERLGEGIYTGPTRAERSGA